MTVNAPTKVAVVGTGSIGSRHLRLLRAMVDVEAIAVPSRPDRAEELAAQGQAVANSLRETKAAIAVIATDTSRHGDDAIAALELGMDVLVEKPMAGDLSGAQRILAAARAAQRRVSVGCNLRFSASLGAFRAALPRIGALHAVSVQCHSFLPEWRPDSDYRSSYSARADEGGVLRDLVHEIDYSAWLFGAPRSVCGRVRNTGRLGIGSDEQADAYWESPSGALVSIRLDYLSRPTRRGIVARGANGELGWDAVANTVKLAPADSAPTVDTIPVGRDDTYIAQLRATLEAHRGRVDARQATGDDGALALAICEALRNSSERRAEVDVAKP